MSALHERIVNQGQVADSGYHPHGTAATPMTTPLARVRYVADSDVYYEELQPLIAADGAIIPSHTGATVPAVHPAGRP